MLYAVKNKLLIKYNKFLNLILSINISGMDIFEIISTNNILLYKPIEYYGFLLFIDIIFNINSIKVLLDCYLYGIIELFKLQRELEDQFFIAKYITESLSNTKLKFLKKIAKINIISNFEDKYDVIIISDIFKVKYYINNITEDGMILCYQKILDINDIFINELNFYKDKFNYIEFIRPSINTINGEFIIIFNNNRDNYQYLQMDLQMNFLNDHIKYIINLFKYKYYINKIIDEDTKNKIIYVYKKNNFIKIINLANKFNLPLKPSIDIYYDNKLIKITNKLYSIINPIKYQLLNFEEINLKSSNKITLFKNFKKLSINLNKIKRAIDTIDTKVWYTTTFEIDNYKYLGKYIINNYKVLNNINIKVSNAFLKIYEILMTFNLFDLNKELKTFHFCEAPGMFIIGLNHYIQTKTNIKSWKWYANTITKEGNINAVPDRYNFIKNYPNNWLFGPKNGDITKIESMHYFKEILYEVDFITSDCGISTENESPNLYEELIAFTDFCQFLNTLNLLKIGGSCVLKIFIPLEKASNICMVYMTTQIFEYSYIFKPITSRSHNSEVYLVCINYLNKNEIIINHLFEILINNKFNSNLQWIEDIPKTFIDQLEDYIVDISRQQISFLLNIFYFVQNNIEIKNIFDKKNKLFINWCKIYNFNDNYKNKLL
jgi:23S rRNA U2552 (ribose-2'-O)-methylase RlmE/FtsJ